MPPRGKGQRLDQTAGRQLLAASKNSWSESPSSGFSATVRSLHWTQTSKGRARRPGRSHQAAGPVPCRVGDGGCGVPGRRHSASVRVGGPTEEDPHPLATCRDSEGVATPFPVGAMEPTQRMWPANSSPSLLGARSRLPGSSPRATGSSDLEEAGMRVSSPGDTTSP